MARRRRLRRHSGRANPKLRRSPSASATAVRIDAKQSLSSESGLTIGSAHDPAEKAADQLADRVVRMPDDVTSMNPGTVSPGGGRGKSNYMSDTANAESRIQTKSVPGASPVATGAGAPTASHNVPNAIRSMGTGKPLAGTERAFFEPRLGADLSTVRIHDGAAADKASRSINARAFAWGENIAFAGGERQAGSFDGRKLMAHELAHVLQQGNQLRRELIRQPPGRIGEPPEMSDADRQEALDYNQARFNAVSTEAILDIMGGAGRQAFTFEMIEQIRNWQMDFRLPPDGKIGLRTLEPLCRELLAGGIRTPVLHIIIDGHNFDISNVASIQFDSTVRPDNAFTDMTWGGSSPIRVGPNGFSQGYRGLVHTVRHEIDHADVASGARIPRRVGEFQAEVIEITSPGMLLEGLDGLFGDAGVAWNWWGQMTAAEQRTAWPQFEAARDELQRRFDAASAAAQTRHAVMMGNFATQAAP